MPYTQPLQKTSPHTAARRPGSGIRQRLEWHAARLGLRRPFSRWRRRSRQPTLRAIARLAAVTAAARRITVLLVMLQGLAGLNPAQASAPGELTQWGLQLLQAGLGDTQLALSTTIDVEVTGLVARVYVVQDFRNDSLDWMEGVYRFPLPDGAAVDRLMIKVGERVLEGEIRERQDAERVYQQARSEGKAAGLVQQERVNQFSTRLANIGPGEDIQVMIGFLVNVQWRDGAFALRLPLTFNQRYDPAKSAGGLPTAPLPKLAPAATRPGQQIRIQVDLPGGPVLSRIESRYHDIDIQPLAQGYRVRLADGDQPPDRDFELSWQPELGAGPEAVLSTWDDGEAVYAQLVLIPPLPAALPPQPRELIFIIDTSGSMEGDSLRQAQAALLRAIDQLQADDTFNLVQFNSDSEQLFEQPLSASPAHKSRASEYVRRLNAEGGTEMAPALHMALSQSAGGGRLRQVVFITDGAVGNETGLLEQIAQELGQARLFPVAIGAAPNSRFMRKAAEIGRGSHTHIGRPQDVAERMDTLWAQIRQPALTDICVDWGMPAEYYPELVPDLYAGQPLWLSARLPAEPTRVSLCGQFAGQAWWHEVKPRAGAGTQTLAGLWARRKLEALNDSLMFGADPQQTRYDATRVALEYGLLSAHTSLVAVDATPIRVANTQLRKTQVASLLPAGSTLLATGFPATATGWRTQLALSVLVLFISGALLLNPGVRPGAERVRARQA